VSHRGQGCCPIEDNGYCMVWSRTLGSIRVMKKGTEYKGSRVMAEPYDVSLMDSNWIYGPSGQNGGAAPKMVLEIGTVLMIADDFDLSWIGDQFHYKGYLLRFPCICRTSKMEVVYNLDVNLNTRWSWSPSWTQTWQF
jgi:hypothetical protein